MNFMSKIWPALSLSAALADRAFAEEASLLLSLGLLVTNPQFQTDLLAEATKIENDASSFKVWPILQLHLLYRF